MILKTEKVIKEWTDYNNHLNVAFFGSQVTKNLVALLNTLGDSGIAALIVILALMIVYRRLLK